MPYTYDDYIKDQETESSNQKNTGTYKFEDYEKDVSADEPIRDWLKSFYKGKQKVEDIEITPQIRERYERQKNAPPIGPQELTFGESVANAFIPWAAAVPAVSGKVYDVAGLLTGIVSSKAGEKLRELGAGQKEQAEQMRTAAKQYAGGKVGETIQDIGAGSAELAASLPLIKLLGLPAYSGITSAAETKAAGGSDKDVIGSGLSGAASGSLMSGIFSALGKLPGPITPRIVGGTTMGGVAAAQGGDIKDIARETALGGIMTGSGRGEIELKELGKYKFAERKPTQLEPKPATVPSEKPTIERTAPQEIVPPVAAAPKENFIELERYSRTPNKKLGNRPTSFFDKKSSEGEYGTDTPEGMMEIIGKRNKSTYSVDKNKIYSGGNSELDELIGRTLDFVQDTNKWGRDRWGGQERELAEKLESLGYNGFKYPAGHSLQNEIVVLNPTKLYSEKQSELPIEPTPTTVKQKAEKSEPIGAFRIQEEGDIDFNKPQGLYLAIGEGDLVGDLSGKRTDFLIKPQKPLVVEPEFNVDLGRMPGIKVPASSGIKALKKLVGDNEFGRLAGLSKRELINELYSKHPDINWNKYYDRQEILEGYAGTIAKQKGYDSIVGDNQEIVVLNKGILIDSKKQLDPTPPTVPVSETKAAAEPTRESTAKDRGLSIEELRRNKEVILGDKGNIKYIGSEGDKGFADAAPTDRSFRRNAQTGKWEEFGRGTTSEVEDVATLNKLNEAVPATTKPGKTITPKDNLTVKTIDGTVEEVNAGENLKIRPKGNGVFELEDGGPYQLERSEAAKVVESAMRKPAPSTAPTEPPPTGNRVPNVHAQKMATQALANISHNTKELEDRYADREYTVATHLKMPIDEQMRMAEDFIDSDPELANRVVYEGHNVPNIVGESGHPLKEEAVLMALENRAIKSGDVEGIMRFAYNSPMQENISQKAKSLRILNRTNPENPIRNLQDIKETVDEINKERATTPKLKAIEERQIERKQRELDLAQKRLEFIANKYGARGKYLSRKEGELEKKISSQDFIKPRFSVKGDKEFAAAQARVDNLTKALNTLKEIKSIRETGVSKDDVANLIAGAKKVSDARSAVTDWDDRSPDGAAREYGRALYDYFDNIGQLKLRARHKSAREILAEIKSHPLRMSGKGILKVTGTLKSLMSSWDDSALGRQGVKIFFRNNKTWRRNALNSFRDIGRAFGNKNAMREIGADVLSRPNAVNGEYKKLALDLTKPEEAFPEQWHEKIPYLGAVYRASDAAFTGFQYRNRADLADFYLDLAKAKNQKLGKEDYAELGKFINAQTGRGYLKGNKEILNKLFFSPRFFKSNFDFLLGPAKYKNSFVRREALKALFAYAGGVAGVLAISKMIDPKSVEADPASADFGKIRVGSTRFDITGGIGPLITLSRRLGTAFASSLIVQPLGGKPLMATKSSTTGKYSPLTTGKGYQKTGQDALVLFAAGKFGPLGSIFWNSLRGTDNDRKAISYAGLLKDIGLPMVANDIIDAVKNKDGASLAAIIPLDFFGIGVNTYGKGKPKKWVLNK